MRDGGLRRRAVSDAPRAWTPPLVLLLCLVAAPPARAKPLPADCGPIARCVAVAPKAPGNFENYLSDQLERWTCPRLVDALAWEDPKGRRTKDVHDLIGWALQECPRHTTKSAETLLRLALEAPTTGGLFWIAALAKDDVGRWLLAEHLDATSNHDEVWRWCAYHYVSAAGVGGRLRKHDPLPDDVRARYESPEEQQRVARYVDALWSAYLLFRTPGIDATSTFQLVPPTDVAEFFSMLFASRAEFDDRFIALLRTETAAARVPSAEELSAYVQLRERRPEVFDDLLTWAASSNQLLHQRAAETLVTDTMDSEIWGGQPSRLCSAVRPLLLVPAFTMRAGLLRLMPFCISGSSREEQTEMLNLVRQAEPEQEQQALQLIVALGEVVPEVRPPIEALLLSADLDQAEELQSRVYWHPPAWLRAPIDRWLRALNAERLSEPVTQERFIVLVSLLARLQPEIPPLPGSRVIPQPRAPSHPLAAILRRMEKRDGSEKGPPPPSVPPRPKFEPRLAPLSPQDAAVRAQKFILLWEALLAEPP